MYFYIIEKYGSMRCDETYRTTLCRYIRNICILYINVSVVWKDGSTSICLKWGKSTGSFPLTK